MTFHVTEWQRATDGPCEFCYVVADVKSLCGIHKVVTVPVNFTAAIRHAKIEQAKDELNRHLLELRDELNNIYGEWQT